MYHSPAYFNDDKKFSLQGDPSDDRHRKIQFDLCRAIDLTKLSMVKDELVKAGMNPHLAELYDSQAGVLLALLCSENNRIHGF